MELSKSITTENMRVHSKEPNFSLERSLGHAVLAGTMTAEQAYEYIDAYEHAVDQFGDAA